jgi:energy-coupling factor transporter ATP-binding protein EcfA2
MILRKIDYHEFDETDEFWSLKDLTLEKINLLVGKNAIGKTRTIRAISIISNLLERTRSFFPESAYCLIELVDKNDLYKYLLKTSNGFLVEELFINSELYVERGKDGLGKLFSVKEKKMIEFQIPEMELVVRQKQDAIHHPYLQKLIDWAVGMRNYKFGSLENDIVLSADIDIEQDINPRNQRHMASIFLKGRQEFGNDFEKSILEAMNTIDYNLTKIDMESRLMYTTNNKKQLVQFIYVIENDRNALLFQDNMSQGMFRALSLLIHVYYNTYKKLPITILIDDIGEGLDYERSTKLIKLLIELAEKNNNIQLIMSTNDRYVMNNVPLKYWQVIQRKGGECQVFNYQNSKEKFEEFKYTGLNNFDFLATDFINFEQEQK